MTFDPAIHCLANTRWHPYPVYVNLADGTAQDARDACDGASIDTNAANFTIRQALINGSQFPFQVNAIGTGSATVGLLESGSAVRLITAFSVDESGSSFVAFREPCEVFKVAANLLGSSSDAPFAVYLNWRDSDNHLRLLVGVSSISFEIVTEGEATVLQTVDASLFPTTARLNIFIFWAPASTVGACVVGYGVHNVDRTVVDLFSTTLELPVISHGPAVGCPAPRAANFSLFRGCRTAFLCEPYRRHYRNSDLAEYLGEDADAPQGEGFVTAIGLPVRYNSGVGLPALVYESLVANVGGALLW